MGAFRKLLSSKEEFAWNKNLQREFEVVRQTIGDKVEEGVKLFKVGHTMALVTDWSKEVLEYVLLQKICTCNELTPSCCSEGWTTIHIGSRSCSQAEGHYLQADMGPRKDKTLDTWMSWSTAIYRPQTFVGAHQTSGPVEHHTQVTLSKGEFHNLPYLRKK